MKASWRIALLVAALVAVTACVDLPAPPRAPDHPRAALTREQAIAAARAVAPERDRDGVLQAIAGRFALLGSAETPSEVVPRPRPDTLVWRINLGFVSGPLNAEGTVVILDFFDGRVIQTYTWIS